MHGGNFEILSAQITGIARTLRTAGLAGEAWQQVANSSVCPLQGTAPSSSLGASPADACAWAQALEAGSVRLRLPGAITQWALVLARVLVGSKQPESRAILMGTGPGLAASGVGKESGGALTLHPSGLFAPPGCVRAPSPTPSSLPVAFTPGHWHH